MHPHHYATVHNIGCLSAADLSDTECVWVGWCTPEGTHDTRMVGLTSLDSTVHVMTDVECRYIQAAAEYNPDNYATVWAGMVK